MVKHDNPTQKGTFISDIVWFLGGAAIIVLINIIAQQFFFRVDLTEDKRYTVSDATQVMLEKMNNEVYVEVFLEGDFPAGFERLQTAIREKLEEFRVYAGDNIQYKFTNPNSNPDPNTRNQFFNQLAKRGLQPTNLQNKENGQTVEKIIFPGAIISTAGGAEIAVTFLKGNQAAPPEVRLNQSVEGVEYELSQAIRRLTNTKPARIGVLQGHGELNGTEFYDMGITLKDYYAIEPVKLQDVATLDGFDAIICAKPDSFFTDAEKYKIDQYVVKGGKALFFIDPVKMELDSINPESGSLALPYDLNLGDLFFSWGLRINPDLVMDINSAAIPMVVGYAGDRPNTQLIPWGFFPLINNFGNHPVVKNMDALYLRFASTIDTVKTPAIRKTELFSTSPYSRIMPGPARVNFNEARNEPNPKQYNRKNLPLAYLLEGEFKSSFAFKINDEAKKRTQFKEMGYNGKVLVVADGDFVRNDFSKRTGQTYPLGFDRFAQVQFANKDFVMNCLNYMLDEKGLIVAKSKDIKLRPLDRPRIAKQKGTWQFANIVVPVLIILIFGAIRLNIRKRRFTRFTK